MARSGEPEVVGKSMETRDQGNSGLPLSHGSDDNTPVVEKAGEFRVFIEGITDRFRVLDRHPEDLHIAQVRHDRDVDILLDDVAVGVEAAEVVLLPLLPLLLRCIICPVDSFCYGHIDRDPAVRREVVLCPEVGAFISRDELVPADARAGMPSERQRAAKYMLWEPQSPNPVSRT